MSKQTSILVYEKVWSNRTKIAEYCRSNCEK